MAKYRKRLEALSEIYRSEVLYTEDLKIWGEDFRRYLFQSETLTIEKKHALSKTLFINLDSIIELHEIIIKELQRRNSMMAKLKGMALPEKNGDVHITEELADKYKDLEYHSVYYKYLDRFNSYKYYVSRLPTVEFNLDKECSKNISFAKELSIFFQDRDINLGPKHFIYRASQKLARYSILWKAALHYEENSRFRSGIEELMKRLKEITLEVDRTYGNINESYRVYRFSSELYYSNNVKKRIPLNLFQKKRTIIKEADIIIKNKYITEAKLLRFILLDTVILLCDIVRQGNIELKHISSDPMPLYKYTVTDQNIGFSIENQQLMDMYKLFILEIGGRDIVVFFFRDANTRNMYKNIIKNAIDKQKESLNSNIKIRNLLEQTNLKIQCCATQRIDTDTSSDEIFSENSQSDTEKDKPCKKFKPEEMTEFQKRAIKIIKKDTQKKKLPKRWKATKNQFEDQNYNLLQADSGKTLDKNGNTNDNIKISDTSINEYMNKELDNSRIIIDGSKTNKYPGSHTQDSKFPNQEIKTDTEQIRGNNLQYKSISDANKETQYESQIKKVDKPPVNNSSSFLIQQNCDHLSEIFSDSSESSNGCTCNFKNQIYKEAIRHGRKLNFETRVHRGQGSENSSSETENENDQQQKPSFFQRVFNKSQNRVRTHSFTRNKSKIETCRYNDEPLLFGTDEGLYIKRQTQFEKVFENSVDKIVYDANNNIICFLSEGHIEVAAFVPSQTSLETKTIANKVSDFYYGKTADKLTIASLNVSNSATTTICLFKVVIENNVFSVIMDRKLFVGCLVYEISFFETMLVIACKDFEMVDSDTLKTQELVDPLDLCIPFYFKELKTVTALCVFTISKNLYLVCYDTMGFFIDKYGRTVKQDTIFVWYFTPCKIKVVKKFLICLGKQEMAIWSLSNGKIVYFKKIDNLGFVEGANSLLLHDEHNMYKIDL